MDQWLIVLKILDPSLPIKLNKSLMELSKSQVHIVQLQHGTHVIGVQLIQLEKEQPVFAVKDIFW